MPPAVRRTEAAEVFSPDITTLCMTGCRHAKPGCFAPPLPTCLMLESTSRLATISHSPNKTKTSITVLEARSPNDEIGCQDGAQEVFRDLSAKAECASIWRGHDVIVQVQIALSRDRLSTRREVAPRDCLRSAIMRATRIVSPTPHAAPLGTLLYPCASPPLCSSRPDRRLSIR